MIVAIGNEDQPSVIAASDQGDDQLPLISITDDNACSDGDENLGKNKSKVNYSTLRLKMRRKFERYKAKWRRRKAIKRIKYSSLNNEESEEVSNKTYKKKLKRSTPQGETQAMNYDYAEQERVRPSYSSVDSSTITSTSQMNDLDLRPLVIEIFD